MKPKRRAELASRVLAAYAEWGVGTEVGGEWGWVRREARQPLFDSLASGDPERVASVIFDFTGNTWWTGLVSTTADIDRDIATWRNTVGDGAVDIAEGGYIYHDTTRHDAEAWALLAGGARNILDIGGGYGGLALRLFRRCPTVRYVDVDLADTLYLAYGYLAPRLPNGAVSLGYDPNAPISLVPESHIPDGLRPDVVCNYRSWGEMAYEDVARYFALIGEWAPLYVIHENSMYHTTDTGASVFNHPEFLIYDYPALPGYTVIESAPSPWSAGAGRYVRQVLLRHP